MTDRRHSLRCTSSDAKHDACVRVRNHKDNVEAGGVKSQRLQISLLLFGRTQAGTHKVHDNRSEDELTQLFP